MSQSAFEGAGAQQAVVQITLGQVYNEVRQTHEAVQGLVQSLEPIKDKVADHETRLRLVDGLPNAVEELESQVDDHEVRLRLVDGLPAALVMVKTTANEALVDHEKRMRTVERKAAVYAGGAAVFAGSAGSLITWALTRH
jgi:hypothetical protein